MREKFRPSNTNFWLWASLTGLLFVVVALAPQFDLINARGADWNGVYAINEFDELAYMAYVQSIIDGSPRRSSPYSGRTDSAETPQKESLFSIQFFSTYPLALTARVFGLSGSQAMILLSAVVGFLSAFAVFSLFFIFFRNAPLSFVGTTAVLFGGALVAGQGSLIAFISPESVHYHFSMLFLRRTNPATSFPALFLFFLFAFQFFIARPGPKKIGFGAAAFGCFTVAVYSYFYHWTTALAWFFALCGVWMIFNFKSWKRDFIYLAGLGVSLVLVLVPWAIMLSNRAESMDSAQLMVHTRQPDLWRIPEILSYLTIAALFLLKRKRLLSSGNRKFVFILSFALVSPIVFNQQIFTGRSLQPFHYQYFCANYIAAFAFLGAVFELARKTFQIETFHKLLVLLAAGVFLIGYFDILSSLTTGRKQNIWRDELFPAAQRIKALSKDLPARSAENPPVVVPFDFSYTEILNSEDLPGLSSQPTMWSLHHAMFPDIDWAENTDRLNKFIYFQNFSPERLRKELRTKNGWLVFGYFGPGRVWSLLTTEYSPVTEEEIEATVEKYKEFCRNFDYLEAQKHVISFVLVHREFSNDLSRIDQWYERGEGEQIGKYILYRVKLRPKQQ
jgi:hypothetical protein